MKKILLLVLASLLLTNLTACTRLDSLANPSDQQATTSNKAVQLDILDGEYILADTRGRTKTYLALKLKVKNQTQASLTFSPDNLALYDEGDEKISAEFLYFDPSQDFDMLDLEQVSKGRSVTGYVFFEVQKDQTYELEFSAINEKTYKRTEPVTLTVKASDYTDKSQEALKAAEHFVASVFLSEEVLVGRSNLSQTGQALPALLTNPSSSPDSQTFANTNEARADFLEDFADDLALAFDLYSPSEADLTATMISYIKANAQRGKVDYSLKSYTPTTAEVAIRPQTIDLSALDTDRLIQEFAAKNPGVTSTKEAERYIFEQIPNQLASLPLKSPDFMDREGLTIRFIKEDGKWVLDESEENYQADYLYQAFSGYADDLFFLVYLPS